MNRLFIADLHLDSSAPQKLVALEATLATAIGQDCEVYILGDLVETWIGDDDDSEFADSLRDVLRTSSRHIPLYLMHGNRDFLIGAKFTSDVGATLLNDPTVIKIQGERVLLSHGDAYCTSDEPYQEIRTQFRSTAWQNSFLSKSLADRRTLAAKMREQSKEAIAGKNEYITDVVEESIVSAMQKFECQTMIHGHTHRPGLHRLNHECIRYVLGDWGRCGWLIHSTPQIQLECFAISNSTAT